jgi:hypothetical protein
MKRRGKAIPEPIADLGLQLDQFRSKQPGRTKLPEPLWQAAVELARQYGVYAVAHPLRLDYMGLRRRLAEAPSLPSKAARATFVELKATLTADCLVEFESLQGAKMRIHWKATTEPDWTRLLRAWRDTER